MNLPSEIIYKIANYLPCDDAHIILMLAGWHTYKRKVISMLDKLYEHCEICISVLFGCKDLLPYIGIGTILQLDYKYDCMIDDMSKSLLYYVIVTQIDGNIAYGHEYETLHDLVKDCNRNIKTSKVKDGIIIYDDNYYDPTFRLLMADPTVGGFNIYATILRKTFV